MSPKSSAILLLLLMVGSFLLHLLPLQTGAIPFYYDTARDAFTMQSMAHGDLKFQGPPSSTPGLFHGVAYYYLLAPWYAGGQGDPRAAVVGLSLFLLLVIPVTYLIAYTLFRRPALALLSAAIIAGSLELARYSTWLSNPAPALVTIPLYYLALIRWRMGKPGSVFLAGIALGLSIQWEIFFAFHAVAAVWVIGRIRLRQLVGFIGVTLATTSSMLLVQLKSFSITTSALLSLVSGSDATVAGQSISYIVSRAARLTLALWQHTLHPNMPSLLVITSLAAAFYLLFRHHRSIAVLLALWSLAFVAGLKFGGSATPFITLGMAPVVALLISTLVHYLPYRLLAVGIAVYCLVSSVIASGISSRSVSPDLVIQPDLQLAHELPAIDYMYTHARAFSVNSLGAPLYVNTTWSYLLNWYGYKKYGSVPYFHGHDQVGQLGNNLSTPPASITTYYFIVDPPESNLTRWIPEARGYEDSRTSFVSSTAFGQITIETRQKRQ